MLMTVTVRSVKVMFMRMGWAVGGIVLLLVPLLVLVVVLCVYLVV